MVKGFVGKYPSSIIVSLSMIKALKEDHIRNWPSAVNSKNKKRTLPDFVAGGGLEPPTSGLWARRTTICSFPRRYLRIIETKLVFIGPGPVH